MPLFLSTCKRTLPALALFLLLTGCASDKDKAPPEKPVEELYTEASDLMDKREFSEAARRFEEVERQHPYSQWATRAQLMSGYAFYQALDYDSAVTAYDQFIRIHPGNDNIAYAYYMRALCDYERLADVRRDQSYAQNALQELQTVVSRFPQTTYAKDAVLKIALVNDHLAGAEMEVGRNYLTQHLYTAAVGRFKTVVEKYQTTSHVPEALHRLVESYLALGIPQEAKMTAAVLGHNFPGSSWYENSYSLLVKNNLASEGDKEGWLNRN
ncbi:MAG: outer membrane protein assembly factor BamD [Alphaproteobacteria bacterium]|nr:outer membrane protein assembly factor BamD [Alphaproteobacteria bacterium]